jgi:hypothetical protein
VSSRLRCTHLPETRVAGIVNGIFLRRNTVVLAFGACEHPMFGPKQYKFHPMNMIVVSGHNLVFWHRTHPVCANSILDVQREEQIHWPLPAFDSALSTSLQLVGKELAVGRRLHLIDDGQVEVVQCLQLSPSLSVARACFGLNLADFKRSGRFDQLLATANTTGLSDMEAKCAYNIVVLPSDPTHCQEPLKVPCADYAVACESSSDRCTRTCPVTPSVLE